MSSSLNIKLNLCCASEHATVKVQIMKHVRNSCISNSPRYKEKFLLPLYDQKTWFLIIQNKCIKNERRIKKKYLCDHKRADKKYRGSTRFQYTCALTGCHAVYELSHSIALDSCLIPVTSPWRQTFPGFLGFASSGAAFSI